MPEDRHSGVPGGGGSGANVKSGTANVTDNSTTDVIFNTPFTSIPRVTATLHSNAAAVDVIQVQPATTTGFTLTIYKGHGGSGHQYVVDWIATDAGDP